MPPPARDQVRRAAVATAALTAVATGAVGAAAAPPDRPPQPEIRAFKPTADTYVTAAAPRTNFGHARTLRVDGAPVTTTYVRFELKGLRGDPEGVTLLLHSTAATRTPYQVRSVRYDDWNERRLTYANAPRLSLRYAASRPVRRGRWSAVDVTAFVDGDDVSLAITTRSPRGVSFGSRESRYGPRLAVQLQGERTDASELLERLRRK